MLLADMLSPGSKAPQFTLHDLDGAPHSLAEILSRGPVLLALFKISCPVCQRTLPLLSRISNLQVITISQDDVASTRRFQAKFAVSLTTLLDREDDGYPVSNAFGISFVPSLFLVETDGTIVTATEGFVKTALEALGVPFRDDETVPAWAAG